MSVTADNEQLKLNRGHPEETDLSREKIRQLLAAIGSGPKEEAAETAVSEYNWRQPHYFNKAQLRKLDSFAQNAGAAVAGSFAALYHGDFNVNITSVSQHFADEIIERESEKERDSYYFAFGISQKDQSQKQKVSGGAFVGCGVVCISMETALALITQLLGDSDAEKDSKTNLSQLEEVFLLDIASGVIGAFASAQRNCDFQPAQALARGQFPLELRGTQELCRIGLSLAKGQSQDAREIRLLILCEKLELILGKAAAPLRFAAEENRKAILEHLHQVPACVNSHLACTFVSFAEIMGLQAGDILLLDKRIDEPIELTVDGRPVLRGKCAKSGGKYAVVITEDTKAMLSRL